MWCETMTSGELASVSKADVRLPLHLRGQPVCGAARSGMTTPKQSFRCQVLCQEMYGYDGGPLYAYASAGGWEFGGGYRVPVQEVLRRARRHPDARFRAKRTSSLSRCRKTSAKPERCRSLLGMARMQAEYGMPVTLQIGSPLTWAGSVIGEERMMNWLIKKPELVHIVLDKVTEFADQGGRVLRQGVRGRERSRPSTARPRRSNKLISPKQFESLRRSRTTRRSQRARHRTGRSRRSSSTSAASRTRTCKLWQQVPLPKRSVLSFGREVASADGDGDVPGQIIAGNVDPTLIQEGKAEEVLDAGPGVHRSGQVPQRRLRAHGRLRRAAAGAAGERVPAGQGGPGVSAGIDGPAAACRGRNARSWCGGPGDAGASAVCDLRACRQARRGRRRHVSKH